MDVRRDIGGVGVAAVLPSAVTVSRAAHQMATRKRSELKEHLAEEYLPGWKERGVVSAFVTDNAANMKKAFEDHTRVSCACHNLNLVVGHALGATALRDPAYAALARQIAVCKSLVSLVKRKGLNHLLEKSLKQQVDTRWNSLLTMIRSVLEALPELRSQERFAQPDVSDLVDQLSRSQLHALIDLLQPFEMASEQLSAARYSTLHLVVPAKERLMRSLSVKADDTFAIKRLKESLRRLLDEKFILDDEHFMAAALWPPHRHFRGMQTVSQAKVRQVHQSLEEEARYQLNGAPQVQEMMMNGFIET
ncbi:Transposable element Hobo transposase [Amphibalanus amphitrite]|uniref:Transposable element Hobo transposase n=1 Tax=Amphibalanus amphitrite TaxID=1232801 RepID=A0A6A4V2Q4_AMPAM|nr:Transposable element Hobo transposase [Amphibalanus amphitrite]